MAQGRQQPRSTKAVPIRMGPCAANLPWPFFCPGLKAGWPLWGDLAAGPQFGRQPLLPIRKLTVGLHNPCTPARNRAGWMTLPGQMRMPRPQRRQRSKRLLVQRPRRTDEVGVAVGPGKPADAPHGGQEQAGPGHDKAGPERSGKPASPAAEGLAAKVTRPAGSGEGNGSTTRTRCQ